MGDWYTIGLALGLALGCGVILSGVLATSAAGIAAAALLGAAAGVGLGAAIGDTGELLAGAAGGLLGAAAAAAVVLGARRRGGTRLGVAAYVGAAGVLLALLALVPVAGYVEAVAAPLLAVRMRTRQAARYAGLRTLAK